MTARYGRSSQISASTALQPSPTGGLTQHPQPSAAADSAHLTFCICTNTWAVIVNVTANVTISQLSDQTYRLRFMEHCVHGTVHAKVLGNLRFMVTQMPCSAQLAECRTHPNHSSSTLCGLCAAQVTAAAAHCNCSPLWPHCVNCAGLDMRQKVKQCGRTTRPGHHGSNSPLKRWSQLIRGRQHDAHDT